MVMRLISGSGAAERRRLPRQQRRRHGQRAWRPDRRAGQVGSAAFERRACLLTVLGVCTWPLTL